MNINKYDIKAKFKFYLTWFFKSYIWIFILLFLFDIISKQIVLHLNGGWDVVLKSSYFENYTFIPGFISFELLLNKGAGFGIGGNIENDILRRTLMIGTSLIMCILFIVFYILKFKKLNGIYKGILMSLLAGAFGNFVDRTFYPDGCVIDFIKFDFMNFATFNIADSILVVSIVILIIYFIYDIVKHGGKTSIDNDSNNEENIND